MKFSKDNQSQCLVKSTETRNNQNINIWWREDIWKPWMPDTWNDGTQIKWEQKMHCNKDYYKMGKSPPQQEALFLCPTLSKYEPIMGRLTVPYLPLQTASLRTGSITCSCILLTARTVPGIYSNTFTSLNWRAKYSVNSHLANLLPYYINYH